jgi:hypothetical protein
VNNFFATEELILTRLESLNGLFRLISTGRSLPELKNHPGPVPALYLIYGGQKPYLGAGLEQAIHQQWSVVIVVRSAHNSATGAGEREEAGPLLIRVCETLLGWQANSETGPLTLQSTPGPTAHNGYGYYPLQWSSRLILRGLQ